MAWEEEEEEGGGGEEEEDEEEEEEGEEEEEEEEEEEDDEEEEKRKVVEEKNVISLPKHVSNTSVINDKAISEPFESGAVGGADFLSVSQDSSLHESYIITGDSGASVVGSLQGEVVRPGVDQVDIGGDINEPESVEEVRARNKLYGRTYMKKDQCLYLSESENEEMAKSKSKPLSRSQKKALKKSARKSANKGASDEKQIKINANKTQNKNKPAELVQSDLSEFISHKKRTTHDTSLDSNKGPVAQKPKQ